MVARLTALYAATLSGKSRNLLNPHGRLLLQDVATDGRALVTLLQQRRGNFAHGPAGPGERDITLFDWGIPRALSTDGLWVLFDETGEGGGAKGAVFLRNTDGSPAVRLSDGVAGTLSPDGKWALAMSIDARTIFLASTHVGEPQQFVIRGLESEAHIEPDNFSWTGDGKTICVSAAAPGHGSRIYLVDFVDRAAHPISPEGYYCLDISPDGNRVVARNSAGSLVWLTAGTGAPHVIPGDLRHYGVAGWSSNNREIYTYNRQGSVAKVERVDVESGRRTPFRELAPADPAGVIDVWPRITPDGKYYVYSVGRHLAELFVVSGLR